MRKINLGCGNDILKGFENYDLYPLNDNVKKIDLNKLPLPFESNSIDEICLSQVLEHLTVHPYDFINECYRILKHEGKMFIGVPSFSHSLQHIRGYHPKWYFDVLKGNRKMKYEKQSEFIIKPILNKFSIKLFLYRLYEVLSSMGYEKKEWWMIKK